MFAVRTMAGVGLVGLIVAACAMTPTATDQSQQLAQQDVMFANEAAAGGLTEVALGQLAQQRAGSDAVAQFGQRMVQDHTRANQQLMTLAQQKGIELPQQLPADAQQEHTMLQQLPATEFDRAYMEGMVRDHETTVALFENEARAGQDAELRAFAEQSLPVLREHLQMAEQTRAQIAAAPERATQAQR